MIVNDKNLLFFFLSLLHPVLFWVSGGKNMLEVLKCLQENCSAGCNMVSQCYRIVEIETVENKLHAKKNSIPRVESHERRD